jgi:hypothetical protein
LAAGIVLHHVEDGQDVKGGGKMKEGERVGTQGFDNLATRFIWERRAAGRHSPGSKDGRDGEADGHLHAIWHE